MPRPKGSKNKRSKITKGKTVINVPAGVFPTTEKVDDIFGTLEKVTRVKAAPRNRRKPAKKSSVKNNGDLQMLLKKLIPGLAKLDIFMLTDDNGVSYLLENKKQTFIRL